MVYNGRCGNPVKLDGWPEHPIEWPKAIPTGIWKMTEEPPGEHQLGTLVYWDKHRIPVNLTIIFALAVAVYGLWLTVRGSEGGAINPIFIVILGLGTALYSWLTNPRTYLIYTDALYVMYGRPRVKRLGFEEISHLEMRTLNTPDRLRVWPVRGRRVVLMARDPDMFHDQLQSALDDYRQAHPELQILEEPPEGMPPSAELLDDLPGGDDEPPPTRGSNGTSGG